MRPVFGCNLRGQGESDGELTVPGITEDVAQILTTISGRAGEKLDVVVHCSSILSLFLEKFLMADSFECISSLVLYGYLAEPHEHLGRFRRKAAQYGVRFSSDLRLKSAYSPLDYLKIRCPWALIHPTTSENLARANPDQVRELVAVADPSYVRMPENGYSISNRSQRLMISGFVSQELEPVLREMNR